MIRLPAQWEKQSFIQIVFPHKKSDWKEYYDEAIKTFVSLVKAIAKYQQVVVVASHLQDVKKYFLNKKNIQFVKIASNDTWCRDFGGITVEIHNQKYLYDFVFNGWGKKFDAKKDNRMTKNLKYKGIFKGYKHKSFPFVLEGGSICSNGNGIILTTSQCLLHPNRNKIKSKKAIEKKFLEFFGTQKTLWLDYGHLQGDDTDGHIDTLARFVDHNTIVYQSCDDKEDEHYNVLLKMKKQLQTFRDINGKKFQLIALPWISAKHYNNKRLPATYANFLITNEAVLVPSYCDKNDTKALKIMEKLFPHKEAISIDCSVLIRQGGSLHCSTMEYYQTTQGKIHL